jgi:hypothetical protein
MNSSYPFTLKGSILEATALTRREIPILYTYVSKMEVKKETRCGNKNVDIACQNEFPQTASTTQSTALQESGPGSRISKLE